MRRGRLALQVSTDGQLSFIRTRDFPSRHGKQKSTSTAKEASSARGPQVTEEVTSLQEAVLWRRPEDFTSNDELDRVGNFDDEGRPTIFIGIASYRDPMCHETIERALTMARFPSRLRFGIVEQNVPIDMDCFHVETPCEQDPTQILCRYKHQIKIHKVSAKFARGPTWGRHRADSLFEGEYYALQIDAHMYFVKDWDADIVEQFESLRNDFAILSTYPTDFNSGTLDETTGKSLSKTTPIICETRIVNDNQMLKHQSAHEMKPPKDITKPILQVWWAAGISFSRGHRIVRVPYDCCLSMLFDGEEASMAFRAWTNGYDFFTPHHSIVFHPYSRINQPPLFWENSETHPGDVQKSENRLRKIFGLEPRGDYFTHGIERYGLGTKRDITQFWKIFGIDFGKNYVENLCRASTSAQIHRKLMPFLREDGKGIDFARVEQEGISFKNRH